MGVRDGFIILMLLISSEGISGDGLQDGVANGGRNGNPGVKIRLTQKGLNYLNDVVKYQMSVIIPRLHVDDMTFKQLASSTTLSNCRVTNYKAPDVQTMTFHPPNQVILVMKKMDVAVKGHVQGTMGLLSDQGDFDGSASNVDVTYTLKILKQKSGQFGVKTQNCKANVGNFDVNLSNTGVLGQMMQAMKGFMVGGMRPEISKQICAQGTTYFDETANKQLGHIPTKIWLNETDPEQMAHRLMNHGNGQPGHDNRATTTRRPSLSQKGGSGNSEDDDDSIGQFIDSSKNVTKNLMLDYRNIKEPVVSKDKAYIETYNKGEISYHGEGGTPFFPNDFREPTPYPTDRMAYLVASDFVANSMIYQAFTHNLIKYRISPDDTPNLAQYLKTSCSSDFFSGDMCLGSLIPQVQDTFPNSVAEIYVEANKVAPAIFFQRDGMIRIQAPVTVTLNAKKGSDKKLMAMTDVDVTARAKMYIEKQKIRGNVTIDKVDLKMRQNNMKNFGQKQTDELAGSIKNVMGVMGNIYLRKGIPLPVVRAMKLTNTVVNVFDRAIRIDSDWQVDQQVISKMTAQAIRENGIGRVDGIDDTGNP